jgi:deazaflavin-dependent oxidoreductase (nitroreductase family)
MNLNRWLYADGRPNRLARALNRGWALAWGAGLWPTRMNTLEVRGRASGRRRSLPVVVADVGGERYLVSMLGEHAAWVANVRAAGGHAVLRHGRREDVLLEEVAPEERAPVLRRYLEVAPAARTHFAVDRRASLDELGRIAERHPVFRVVARSPGPGGTRS